MKKRVCAYCEYLLKLPFSDELVCSNEESEYADCPVDNPDKDTCDEFCESEVE